MAMNIDRRHILLRRNYSYRKSSVLLSGMIVIIGPSLAIFIGCVGLLNGAQPSILAILFAAITCLPLLYAGIWIVFGFISNRKYELLITSSEVQYGPHNWRWDDIESLNCKEYRPEKYSLIIQTKGFFGHQIELITDELLDEREYLELVNRIVAFHPDIV